MPYRVLSEEQRRQWATDGYLVLKGALPPDDVKRFRGEIDKLHRKHVLNNPAVENSQGMIRLNLLPDNDMFIELMDHPATFDLVLDLMGPYILLSMAQGFVRPPNPDFKGYIHTDGGNALRRIRVTETSWPLQVKIQYFLTDVTRPNSGNFMLFPGSHYRPFPEGEDPISVDTPGAIQLSVKAGDAAVFSHSLWHGVAPNLNNKVRKSLIYCYTQMFIRPFDFNGQPPEILERCTPRQRRLLSDLRHPTENYYAPKDQEKIMEGTSRRKRRKSA